MTIDQKLEGLFGPGRIGGGGGRRLPHQSKGPPLLLFYDIHFRSTDPETFLKVPLAPIYSNFKGAQHIFSKKAIQHS